MKKQLSAGAIIGAIVGIAALIGIVVFLLAKSDPAAQAPNPPPRFDPGAKAAESNRRPPGTGPNGVAVH